MKLEQYFLLFCCLFFTAPGQAASVVFDHPRLIDHELVEGDHGSKQIDALLDRARFFLHENAGGCVGQKGRDREFVRLFSFAFWKTNDARYLKKARELIGRIKTVEPTDDQHVRTQMQAFAYFYDFCFYSLTDKEKDDLEKQILGLIKWLRDHKYLDSGQYGGGHGHYAQISVVVAGLSIYHESPEAADFVNYAIGELQEGFQPFYRALAEDDGSFHMWWEYSRYYVFDTLELCTIWQNATGENLFKTNMWINNVFYFLRYGLRPDLTSWGTGDNHSRYMTWRERMIFSAIASVYSNEDARQSVDDYDEWRKDWPGIDELYWRIFWETGNVVPGSVSNLPMIKGFLNSGAFSFRESWDETSVNALFKCTSTYFFNHSHRDANHFSIWYKNDLAIDSGYYGRYGSEHWWNYYIRTIAHNTVTIFDPDEKFAHSPGELANDGGQQFILKPHYQPFNVDDLKSDEFKVAESGMIEDNDDYALAYGDATKSYSGEKCELFKRYFLWLKKIDNWDHPIIVVFDRVVSTKAEFEKKWLLHSINRPKVRGNLITIKNGGGKLWCYVISPQDYSIDIVGGRGHEFDVNGVNYPPETTKWRDVEEWAGAWRIELSEKVPNKETSFLTVLIPTGSLKMKAPEVEAINGGVRVENWEVVYANDELKVTRADK